MSKETPYSPYVTAKRLIIGGYIKTLTDLLQTVKKTRLARDMKTGPARFNGLIDNPTLFTFEDAYKIADLLEVDRKMIIDIIHNECEAQSKGKRKK